MSSAAKPSKEDIIMSVFEKHLHKASSFRELARATIAALEESND
jgi:hypothetical protein